MALESFLTDSNSSYDVRVQNRVLHLVRPIEWQFIGPFIDETVYAITGHRYKNYIVVTHLYQMENEHHDPRNHFRVSAEQIRATEQESWDTGRLLGIAHRHPPNEPDPSQDDFDGIKNQLIGAVWCEGVVSWYDKNGLLAPNSLFV